MVREGEPADALSGSGVAGCAPAPGQRVVGSNTDFVTVQQVEKGHGRLEERILTVIGIVAQTGETNLAAAQRAFAYAFDRVLPRLPLPARAVN